MSFIRQFFGNMRKANQKVLSIYLPAGYPTSEATLPLLDTLVEAGADMIELGIPFSDPLADGPTIQRASQQAIANGTTLLQSLNFLRLFRTKHPQVPALLMGYANPFFRFGWDRLVDMAAAADVSGFIIPDLPPEECEPILSRIHSSGMDLIFLATPNTPPERLRLINAKGRGFLYAVSLTGVTGARKNLPPETKAFLQRLRRESSHPIMVGFGISTPQLAAQMAKEGNGVIIGSAVIDLIENSPDLPAARKAVFEFVSQVKKAMG